MKIQIDTNLKTIKLEDSVNIGEFYEMMEKLFPDGQWKEFRLEANTVIDGWMNPIIINKNIPVLPYPWIPNIPSPYLVTCDYQSTNQQNGVYNVAIN